MLILHKLTIAVCLTLLFAGSATAQNTRDAELASADSELNEVYNKIYMRLDSTNKEKLKSAQRMWLKMREYDCEWAFVDRRDCLIDRTINRTNELKETYFFANNNDYINILSQ